MPADVEFVVVMNEEEQFSIWPTSRPVPSGWESAGVSGSKDECLDWVEENWTDMRPKSVRERLTAAGVVG